MRLKLISREVVKEEGRFSLADHETRVVDVETGREIPGVVSASWRINATDRRPVLTLELLGVEVEAELGEAGAVEVLKDPPSPPLLLTSVRKLKREVHEQLRHALEDHRFGQPILFDEGLRVYQLVNGEWKPVDPMGTVLSTEVLEAEGIRVN